MHKKDLWFSEDKSSSIKDVFLITKENIYPFYCNSNYLSTYHVCEILNKEIGIGTNNFRVLLVTAKESNKSLVYNNLTNPITIFTDIIVSRETIIMKHSKKSNVWKNIHAFIKYLHL